jgi:hypothetical protein
VPRVILQPAPSHSVCRPGLTRPGLPSLTAMPIWKPGHQGWVQAVKDFKWTSDLKLRHARPKNSLRGWAEWPPMHDNGLVIANAIGPPQSILRLQNEVGELLRGIQLKYSIVKNR